MRRFNPQNRLQGAAALESHPTDGANGVGSDADVVAIPEGVPEEIVDLNEASEVVEGDESDTSEIEAAIEGLESLRVVMMGSLQEQGMTPREALTMNHAIESYTNRLGIRFEMPSQEQFGGTGPRSHATTVALEGLGEMLTKLWNWLVEQITKAKKNIIDYYERVWAEAPRQIKKLEALRDRAAAATKAPEDKEVELSKGLCAKLNISGKVENLQAHVKALSTVSDKLFTEYLDGAVAWAGQVTDATTALVFTSDEAFTTSLEAVRKIRPLAVPSGLADKAASEDIAKGVEGVELKMSELLLGNKAIVAQIASTDDKSSIRDVIDAIAKNQLRLQDGVAEQPKFDSALKITVPAANALKDLAVEAAEVATKVQSFKRNWTKSDEAKTKALSKIKGIKSKIGSAKDLTSENQTAASSALKLLSAVPTVVDQPNQGFTAYLLTTNAAVISYLETCLAKYK